MHEKSMGKMALLAAWSVLVFVSRPAAAASKRRPAPAKGPVKVFILAGQSNMQGDGRVGPETKKGTLEYMVRRSPKKAQFRHLVDEAGRWVARDDVWFFCRQVQRGAKVTDRAGKLTVGLGRRSTAIGPELQFGHVMGDHFDEPVLLIKTAWGGKSIGLNFRSPGAGKLDTSQIPRVQEAIDQGKVKVGEYYRKMLAEVREVVGDLKKHFPQYKGQGHEIAGLCWHQGWNDGCVASYARNYEKNLTALITDVRKDLSIEDLPVVIASSGFGGDSNSLPGVRRRIKEVVEPAQIAVGRKMPNVVCVPTRGFHRPREESPTGASYHWNSNAETYFLVGDAMGQAMKRLLKTKRPKKE